MTPVHVVVRPTRGVCSPVKEGAMLAFVQERLAQDERYARDAAAWLSERLPPDMPYTIEDMRKVARGDDGHEESLQARRVRRRVQHTKDMEPVQTDLERVQDALALYGIVLSSLC